MGLNTVFSRPRSLAGKQHRYSLIMLLHSLGAFQQNLMGTAIFYHFRGP